MSRRKANPNLPMYMVERNGSYETRRPIEDSLRSYFPELTGKKAVKVMAIGKVGSSKRPTDGDRGKHNRNLDAIEARIEPAKIIAPSASQTTLLSEPRLYEPMEIIDAVGRWKNKRIDANLKLGQLRELKELNGIEVPLEAFDGRDLIFIRLNSVHEKAAQIIREQIGRVKGRNFVMFDASCFAERGEFDSLSAIADFKWKFAEALNSEGVILNPDAPILKRAFAVGEFSAAWAEVICSELDCLCGSKLHRADKAIPDTEMSADVDQPKFDASSKLSQLLEDFLKSEPRKDAKRKRTHWRLLIDNMGDIPLSQCEPNHFNKLKVEMREAPLVKSDVYKGVKLSDLICRREEIKNKFGSCEAREPKTIFDYFCSYKAVFEHARILRIIDFNPLEGVMPPKPKPSRKIKAYSDEDIRVIFSKPLFSGSDKVRSAAGRLWGYRKNSGPFIERDGRYYMPVLALFTGARMEELGGARTVDVKRHNGIWYLDLTKRSLKTENSKRIIPLHPQIVQSGGVDFISYLQDRQHAKDEYLFPEFRPLPSEEGELTHEIIALSADTLDDDDKIQDQDTEVIKMTAKYSKWFGNWCRENNVKQKGKNFHSFRHTFKARLRLPDSNEHINDLVTGHTNPSTGAGYGVDPETLLSQLPILYEAVCRVVYPTFPRLPKG